MSIQPKAMVEMVGVDGVLKMLGLKHLMYLGPATLASLPLLAGSGNEVGYCTLHLVA